MVDTIEAFVGKLQADGVEAGRAAAEKLKADAQAQADAIAAKAQADAEKILADAKAEAESIIARGRSELQLASRDTVATLRQSLNDCLNALLAESAKAVLKDLDFLGRTLHDLVILYAKADLERKLHVEINVPGEIRDGLKEWAFKELGNEAIAEVRPSFTLRDKLRQVGFEYTVDGGTVEVTLDSVVAMLSEMITPALRETLDEALKKNGE